MYTSHQPFLRSVAAKLAAVAVGLAIAGLIASAFGKGCAPFFAALARGSLGSPASVILTLSRASILILAGLSVAVPYRGALFNIGTEGQILMGALASVSVALFGSALPGIVCVPLALLASLAAGAFYAAIAGWLKAARGVHEVITAIMLNFIAFHVTAYLVMSGPLGSPDGTPRTPQVATLLRLPALASTDINSLSVGIIIALAAVVLSWWFCERAVTGFRIRAAGGNSVAAGRKGISVTRMTVIAMAAGGALGGLGGASEVLGQQYSVSAGFSPGYGFDGIAVAFLAGGNILAVPVAALFFAALRSSGTALQLDADLSP